MKYRSSQKLFLNKLMLVFLLVISLAFLVYTLYICTSSYKIGKERHELKIAETEKNVKDLFQGILENAEEITTRINYSSAFKPLHLSLLEGKEMKTTERVDIANELRNAFAHAVSLDINDLILFADNYQNAFSFSGFIQLEEPFRHRDYPIPYLTLSSVTDELDSHSAKFSFQNQEFLYLMGFRYQGGLCRGVIVISYSVARIKDKLDRILQGNPYQVIYNGKAILKSSSPIDDETMERREVSGFDTPGLKIVMAVPTYGFFPSDQSLLLALFIGAAIFIAITISAFAYSRQYYKPLKEIRTLVTPDSNMENAEFDSMINALKGMIVENKEYRQDIDNLAPLAENGLIHGLTVDTSSPAEMMRYSHFARPFFLIVAVNIDAKEKEVYLLSTSVFEKLRTTFSTKTSQAICYRRDMETWFVWLNSDTPMKEEDITERLFLFLSGSLPVDAVLTIGADKNRTDLKEFKEACTSALDALGIMLVQGKGQIYYSTTGEHPDTGYFVTPELQTKLQKLIEKRDRQGIQELFDSMLKTNLMKYDLDAEGVRNLSLELSITLSKTLREFGMKPTKAGEYSTVEEVFAHYENEAENACDGKSSPTDKEIASEVFTFIDANYADPQLTLGSLSEHMGITAKTIGTYISSRYGETYLSHITNLRMAKAKSLLVHTDTPIDDVAMACGYTSPLTFRRNFRNTTGLTPSEYRLKKQLERNS